MYTRGRRRRSIEGLSRPSFGHIWEGVKWRTGNTKGMYSCLLELSGPQSSTLEASLMASSSGCLYGPQVQDSQEAPPFNTPLTLIPSHTHFSNLQMSRAQPCGGWGQIHLDVRMLGCKGQGQETTPCSFLMSSGGRGWGSTGSPHAACTASGWEG